MAEQSLKPETIRGKWNADGMRFAIVVSDFNRFITDRLLTGALEALARSGATDEQIQIVRVPGSFEIPVTVKKLGQTGKFDSIICVGCILRGETSHYDYVASETSRGIQLAQLDTGVPMIFCVLTCDTLEQAIDRAGLKGGNKGYDAGVAAVEMAHLSRKIAGKAASSGKSSSSTSPSSRGAGRKRSR
jgi:6,7-dimethyl-8-ribityllumazine synthase